MHKFHKALLKKIQNELLGAVGRDNYYLSFPTPDLLLSYPPEKFNFEIENTSGKTAQELSMAYNNIEEISYLVNAVPSSDPFFNLSYSGNYKFLEDSYSTILRNIELVHEGFATELQKWKFKLDVAQKESLKNMGEYNPIRISPIDFYKPEVTNGWKKMSISKSEIATWSDEFDQVFPKAKNYSSAGIGTGMEIEKVEAEWCAVKIFRSWFIDDLFFMYKKGWKFPDYLSLKVSEDDSFDGILPAYISSLIFIRNLDISQPGNAMSLMRPKVEETSTEEDSSLASIPDLLPENLKKYKSNLKSATYRVRGNILDKYQQAIPSRLQLFIKTDRENNLFDGPVTFETDNTGIYRIPIFEEGEYMLRASCKWSLDKTEVYEFSVPRDLKKGSSGLERVIKNFKMEFPTKTEIQVLDSKGKGVKANVILTNINTGKEIDLGSTNASGNITANNFVYGHYEIKATAPGLEDQYSSINFQPPSESTGLEGEKERMKQVVLKMEEKTESTVSKNLMLAAFICRKIPTCPVASFHEASYSELDISNIAVVEEQFQGVSDLKLGDEGEAVLKLQMILSKLNYYNGDCSGIFGLSTQEAVKTIQLASGQPNPTGIFDEETKKILLQAIERLK